MAEPSMNMSLAELEGLAGEAHAHGDLPRAAAAHTCAGALEVEAGRHDSGLEHFARAITAYEGCGQVREALVNVYNRAHTLFLAERYHQSLEEYQALEQRAQAIGAGVDMTRAVVGRWHVHQALGDTESAQATLEQVRVVAHEAQQLPTAGWADYQLGSLAYSQQQYDRAIAMYSSARATYTTLLMGERVAECDQALGVASFYAGDREGALAALDRARERYALHGLQDRVADCERNRAAVLGA